MTPHIPDALRRQTEVRAAHRGEYCRVHQDDRLFAHEIDHIYAEKHGGETSSDNLCLACSECNRYKGSDICSLDIVTNSVVPLFHPRNTRWSDHFQLLEGVIEGISPTGRVTARLLRFNDPDSVDRRRILIGAGRYP
ncbi:MAG: HNH endonuclease signature motif containing protein [Anaerolineae bacterium]